ncbi:MAG: tRNA uridine-5-carboxymethylaminomethyl(34) synthesis GTPase MnmE [Capsulimonadaceae bacterium]
MQSGIRILLQHKSLAEIEQAYRRPFGIMTAMILMQEDTICAPATPPGRGGIGVIRVSGPDAFRITDGITGARPRSWAAARGHTVHHAKIVAERGELIDDVLLAVFHAPRSYTGEDVVEISAHGGPVPMRRILGRLYAAGARAAGPGEFTQRAYLNGKMDLAQAEAVADIIAADTDEAHRLAQRQQGAVLSRAVGAVRDSVLGVLARIEASIDFPEDVGELDVESCRADLAGAAVDIDRLLDTADAGILRREGLKIVLAGRPNVGKSSLMNALLRADRAIVTPIPGTTRDLIEEAANIGGIRVRFVDTAGLRETSDPIELIGVVRSRESAASADLALLVLDATEGMTVDDDAIRASLGAVPTLTVLNKCDLVLAPPGELCVSALTGQNLDLLEAAILEASGLAAPLDDTSAVVTHSRHRHALRDARTHLSDALATVDAALPADFISIDVRGALIALGEITGETATEDIISEIFSRFCIGK